MERLPWIAAVLALSLLAVVVIVGFWMLRRPKRLPPLPTEWSLSARPVFSTDERRVYKLLREALPHHIVLSKLPLVRFSQPSDPTEVRFWYDLLGAINVTFAVCSANGRVLAAIDLDTDRGNSRRILQIKQSVLGACRIRYLRCPVDNLPTAAELQLLVPSSTAATARGPQPGIVPPRDIDEARDSLASTVATRRAAAQRALAGFLRVPGFVLRSRQPHRHPRQQRVRLAVVRESAHAARASGQRIRRCERRRRPQRRDGVRIAQDGRRQ